MLRNKNIFVIALIAIVNALGYGIIIPILYSYSRRFGLSDFQSGLLFALFSLCQFISTPIIGRLSDRFGRKPLLLISLVGTCFSFLIMAFAPAAIFLFLARALDGLTAGNIPVASAVISDTTKPEERAKGFGIIGAAFGFGFIFGPAISAATIGISPAVPFLIAAGISLLAVVLTFVILPETNKTIGTVSHQKLFDFKKLFHSLFDDRIGETLLLSLIYTFAFSMFIHGYQPFAVKGMHLTPIAISVNFTIIGIVGVLAQVVLIPFFVKKFGEVRALFFSLTIVLISFLALGTAFTSLVFVLVSILLSLGNAFIGPMVQTILSRESDETTQGMVQGLNASYMSMGFIAGPIVGGLLATLGLRLPFFGGAIMVLACFYLATLVSKKLRI